MKPEFTLKSVERLTGLTGHTLRAWERRYGAVRPTRSENGRRVYSSVEVDRLKKLAVLCDRGFTISRLAHLNSEELSELVKGSHASANLEKALTSIPSQGLPAETQRIRAMIDEAKSALETFDLERLSQCLLRARLDFSVQTFVLHVISQLMTEVGNEVASGRLSIAKEHALSSLLRNHLGTLLESINPWRPGKLRVLLTTREGDLHEFGILLSAVLFAKSGWQTFYLGPNLPVADIEDSILQLQPQVVLLGSTVHEKSPLPLESVVVRLATFLKGKPTQFWLGGDPAGLDAVKLEKLKILHFRSLLDLDQSISHPLKRI